MPYERHQIPSIACTNATSCLWNVRDKVRFCDEDDKNGGSPLPRKVLYDEASCSCQMDTQPPRCRMPTIWAVIGACVLAQRLFGNISIDKEASVLLTPGLVITLAPGCTESGSSGCGHTIEPDAFSNLTQEHYVGCFDLLFHRAVYQWESPAFMGRASLFRPSRGRSQRQVTTF